MIGRIRTWFQGIFTCAISSYWKVLSGITIYRGYLKSFCVPVINCYACPLSVFACPIGMLQHFVIVGQFPYYILGLFGFVGILVGRMACGWMCPFGFFQEIVYKFGHSKWKIPHYMNYTKYFFLAVVVVYLPYYSKIPWFCRVCPVGKLEAGIPFMIWEPYIRSMLFNPDTGAFIGWWAVFKFFVLMLFFLLMLIAKRPFCKIFCPVGAIMALFNRIGMVNLNIETSGCRECNCCSLLCPMDLDVPRELNKGECIKCLRCTACPHISLNVMGEKVKFIEKTRTRKVVQ